MGFSSSTKQPARFPLVLLAAEFCILVVTVLLVAQWGLLGYGTDFHGTGQLTLRALLVASVMTLSIATVGTYHGVLDKGVLSMHLRIAVGLVVGGVALALLSYPFPYISIRFSGLALVAILTFFFDGTIRPILLDAVSENRSRIRARRTGREDSHFNSSDVGSANSSRVAPPSKWQGASKGLRQVTSSIAGEPPGAVNSTGATPIQ